MFLILNSIEDIFSDNIHLTDIGKYYVACIHFAMIHGVSPVGLANQLHVWRGGAFQAPSLELAQKFQEMAWEEVNQYPKSCLDEITTQNEVQGAVKIKIWPNPVSSSFRLEGISKNSTIQIFNSRWEQVKKNQLADDQTEIDISRFASGFYFVHIKNNEGQGIWNGKILKHD